MIKDILKAFQAKIPKTLDKDDARIALAALMVRLARADGNYQNIEISMIDHVLVNRFGLNAGAAQSLREQAEEIEIHAPDNVRFTRIIKDSVPYEERAGVVEALWSVVLSDGHRDYEEHGFMRLITSLLGVSDRDSAFARQRADKAIG